MPIGEKEPRILLGKEKIEDTKGVIRGRILYQPKAKRKNNDLQILQKYYIKN
jgi:hypothetical protein